MLTASQNLMKSSQTQDRKQSSGPEQTIFEWSGHNSFSTKICEIVGFIRSVGKAIAYTKQVETITKTTFVFPKLHFGKEKVSEGW